MAVKIGVISLGCAKNRVDTEVLLGLLADEAYEFVYDLGEADIALINTCAFINDAKEESINTILEAEQQKRFGSLKGIVVVGCLPQRYRDELKKLIPRVDAFLGVASYKNIVEVIKGVMEGQRYDEYPQIDVAQDFSKRLITTQKPTAYVKIAEGCNNNCSYCTIPSIRGPYQSRKMEDVLTEIRDLAQNGYSEIILIANDTTNYGTDLYDKPSLPELMDKAAIIDGVKWLRVLYCYPDGITDELLDVMMKHKNIVKYIDMPLQHMDDGILKAMNRRGTFEQAKKTVEKIRAKSPDFVVRTTLIVGFPGETRENVAALSSGMKELEFDHLGVFAYSNEEGTASYDMEEQVDEAEKEFRRDSIMNKQSTISLKHYRDRVGQKMDVLVEGKDEQSGNYYGRSYLQAPEVDGKVFIKTKKELNIGEYYKAVITDAYNYDCIAELVEAGA